MPAIYATAPAKTILFGEHAVVYHRPAIAVPITTLHAKTIIIANPLGERDDITIIAPQVQSKSHYIELNSGDFFRIGIDVFKKLLNIDYIPSCEITITSNIPVAAGLGSSAAVAVSFIRALYKFLGKRPDLKEVNEISYEMEKVKHQNPSGIDNTVITHQIPIFFIRDQVCEEINIKKPLSLAIANSGIPSLTKETVAMVRSKWESSPDKFNNLFDQIGAITYHAKDMLSSNSPKAIGSLMIQNHELLQQLGVSCNELDKLVYTAIKAGARGAKLCGAGMGGNIVALIDKSVWQTIQAALYQAGAVQVFITTINPN